MVDRLAIIEERPSQEISRLNRLSESIPSQQDPTVNRLAGLGAGPNTRDFLTELILSDKPLHEFLPEDQAIISQQLLNEVHDPEDLNAQMSSAILFSSMFDISMDEALIMEPELLRQVFGEELKSRAGFQKIKVGVLERFAKKLGQSFASPLQNIAMDSEFGEVMTDIEMLNIKTKQLVEQGLISEDATFEEVAEAERAQRPPDIAAIANKIDIQVQEGKLFEGPFETLTEEEKEKWLTFIREQQQVDDQLRRDIKELRAERQFGSINRALSVPQAEGFADKIIDVGAGVTGFVGKVALFKRFLGGGGLPQEVLAFELTSQVDGSKPGVGAVTALGLAGISRIPSTTIKGTVGKLTAQGGFFAGITAVEGGTTEDIAISFMLPFALRATGVTKNLVGDTTVGTWFKARFPELKGFKNSEINKAHKAGKDWNRVRAGKMTRQQWVTKHGRFAADFSDKLAKQEVRSTQEQPAAAAGVLAARPGDAAGTQRPPTPGGVPPVEGLEQRTEALLQNAPAWFNLLPEGIAEQWAAGELTDQELVNIALSGNKAAKGVESQVEIEENADGTRTATLEGVGFEQNIGTAAHTDAVEFATQQGLRGLQATRETAQPPTAKPEGVSGLAGLTDAQIEELQAAIPDLTAAQRAAIKEQREQARERVEAGEKAPEFNKAAFHGTIESFTDFKGGKDKGDIGVHFGTKAQAEAQLEGKGFDITKDDPGPHIQKVSFSLENPLRTANAERWDNATEIKKVVEEAGVNIKTEIPAGTISAIENDNLINSIREEIKAAGFDGIVYKGIGKKDVFVVFDPDQVQTQRQREAAEFEKKVKAEKVEPRDLTPQATIRAELKKNNEVINLTRKAQNEVAQLNKEIEQFEKTEAETETRTKEATEKLRTNIDKLVKLKGLTNKEVEDLTNKHTGFQKLRGKVVEGKVTTDQLVNLINEIEKTTPTRLGKKVVLSQKTEDQITALKKSLVEDDRLAEHLESGEAEHSIIENIGRVKAEAEAITKQALSDLRERIDAMVKLKGLGKKAFGELALKHTSFRVLTGKVVEGKIKSEQLIDLLEALEKVRPLRIGHKVVLSQKTEDQIASLKKSLIDADRMTDKEFQRILKLATDKGFGQKTKREPRQARFINAQNFITQEEARDLLDRMHDSAQVLRVTQPRKLAVEKDPEILAEFEKVQKQPASIGDPSSKTITSRIINAVNGTDFFDRLYSMRFYAQRLGDKVGEPAIYELYDSLRRTAQGLTRERGLTFEFLSTLPDFDKIAADEEALQRISDAISSKSNLVNKPQFPENITESELGLVKEVENIFKVYEFHAKVGKFFQHLDDITKMPQYIKFKDSIDKALDIYDSKGIDALFTYIETQDWGVVQAGYEPMRSVIRKISTHQMPDIAVGKGHIKVRGIEYEQQERNILMRLQSYMRQMDMLAFVQPKIKAWTRLIDENIQGYENEGNIRSVISTYLNNLKKTNVEDGLVEEVMMRVYSQAITTRVLADPIKPARNLLQNVAFSEDRRDLVNPNNERLTEDDLEYLETFVQQDRVMMSDWAFAGLDPMNLPLIGKHRLGLGILTKSVQRHTLYPASDRLNRRWSFWAKINRVRNAFAKDQPLAEKMIEARFSDMQRSEQELALELLASEGVDVMARYIAQVHTDNTHFLYAREDRSPAEQTRLGKLVLNLALFKRAALEKMVLQMQKATQQGSFKSRLRAAKNIAGLIVMSSVVGIIWRLFTGKENNPYDYIDFLQQNAGGLELAAIQKIEDVHNLMLEAIAKGDKKALAALPKAITTSADYFIPFYDIGTRAIEATIDEKNLDVQALQAIREMIDKEYRSRKRKVIDRSFVEKFQFTFGGPGVDRKKDKE